MASWQADFILIPLELGQTIEKANRRDLDWWSERAFPKSYDKEFSEWLPVIPSWNDGLLWYGEESGNRFDVWVEDGKVTECFVRFDLRQINKALMEGFLSFCAENKIGLLNEQDDIVEPKWAEFRESLMKSAAFKFVHDPVGFMERLS